MNRQSVLEDQEISPVATNEHSASLVQNATPHIHQKALFEDSLLETTGSQRKRRSLATVFSLVSQVLLIGVLIFIPLMYTDVLPKEQLVTFLVAPPPPPPPPPPAPHSAAIKVVKITSEMINGRLRTPTSIPKKILMIKEAEAPPPAFGVDGGVPGGIPGGQLGGVIGGIIGSLSRPPEIPKLYKPSTPTLIRVSQGVTEGLLIHKVQPVYPVLAREARIQGTVVLTALIAKDGTIQNLRVISGKPMLAPAAIDAVKQWRYKPYLLNGTPVEIETTVTVNFNLGS